MSMNWKVEISQQGNKIKAYPKLHAKKDIQVRVELFSVFAICQLSSNG